MKSCLLKKMMSFIFGSIVIFSISFRADAACVDYIPNAHPVERYVVSGDDTVLDIETGLIWDKCTFGLSGDNCQSGTAMVFSWESALALANTLDNYKGSSNWRLPNLKEMHSLTTNHCFSPPINEDVFPNTPTFAFWTSTPYSSPNSNQDNWSYFVNSFRGDTLPDFRANEYHLRLVREK